MMDITKLLDKLTPNADQTCTLTKLEFVQIGAAAAANLLTCEAASVLSDDTRLMLTTFSAMYHSELEKMMFPSEETEPENNDK